MWKMLINFQLGGLWEDDLQSVAQTGFGQNHGKQIGTVMDLFG